MKRLLLGTILWMACTGMALAGMPADEVIDFESLPAGTVVETVFSAMGQGPIAVSGTRVSAPGQNVAVVFDSSAPTGGDFDLGSPNMTCGGPGVGSAGEVGQPTENCSALGHLLIVAENLIDDNGDNLVDSPDDADEVGSTLTLDFSVLGPVTLKSITLLDVEDSRPNAQVDLIGPGDKLLATFVLDPTGDNGKIVRGLGPTSGVERMRITLNGSGSIDNLVFSIDQPQCGNGIVEGDEECDDGNEIDEDECRNNCTLPVCGDGIVDEGEECDDGNDNNKDDCRTDCTLPVCGDGIVDGREECDDGNNIDDDECRNDCTEPVCGDGILDDGEACDDGNDNNDDECRNDCTIPVCGDGIVDDGEACDDGNDNNDDECRNDCTEPVCGDGILDDGEACDDGNEINDDECRNDCTIPVCGDGILDDGEACDDGNEIDDDECRNDCTIPVCGDGILDDGEACDDGNEIDDDECRNDCTIPTCGDGILDDGEACDDGNEIDDDECRNDCTIPVCGDGILDDGEACDDGNEIDDDECRNDCTIPVCGDGILDDGEACDDGNEIDDDECRNDCTIPTCGDGILDDGEACDDGNEINDDECRNDCTIPVCGDGILDDGEACDDGNEINDDECRNDCTIPVCGDGILDDGEACDDGNDNNNDGCRNDCLIPICGDGIVDAGEQCDDGNLTAGDGCDPTCQLEGGEGCTPGFWKNHLSHWSGYAPTDSYNTVFGVDASFGSLTLLQAAEQGGGGEIALGRHAVAALLNAANAGVEYDYSVDAVLAIVQEAYDTGEFEMAKNLLAFANEQGCPLSGGNNNNGLCGDGILDNGEACDDGNDNNDDDCRNDCTLPTTCGDGILDDGEACDDGNDNNDDDCRNDCTLPTTCGDGILDDGEACDDGNLEPGDGCDAGCELEEGDGGEGCTPGFWKNHLSHWSGYAPTDSYNAVFGIEASFGSRTLLHVASQGGGGEKALGRHAVAALLNAANAGVDYDFTVADVLAIVQGAYDAGEFEMAKGVLSGANEDGCPLHGGNTTGDGRMKTKPSRAMSKAPGASRRR